MAGADADGNNGPTTDGALAGIGVLVDEMEQASPPPKSRGGSELRL